MPLQSGVFFLADNLIYDQNDEYGQSDIVVSWVSPDEQQGAGAMQNRFRPAKVDKKITFHTDHEGDNRKNRKNHRFDDLWGGPV